MKTANEMAEGLERIARGALSDYEGVEADERHILLCAELIRNLGPQRLASEPVAWTVVGPDGESSIGGWLPMKSHEYAKKHGTLSDGYRFAYAYPPARP